MKLLFITPKPVLGGAEKITALVAGHMANKGHEVFFASFCDAQQSWTIPLDDRISRIALGRGVTGVRRLARQFASGQYDTVFSSFLDINIIVLALQWLTPRSRIIIRDALAIPFSVEQTRFPAATLFLSRFLYKFADVRIAQSCEMSTINRKLLGEENVFKVIPNPVGHIPNVPPRPPKNYPARFLAVGRLVAQKGFDNLIDAFVHIHASHPDVRLDIVGDGRDKASLEQRIQSAGAAAYIHLHSWQANLTPFYLNADAYILSSRYEGFCNTALEAMAFGIPLVASTQNTGIKDLARHMREAVLVDTGSPTSLRSGIHGLIENYRHFDSGDIMRWTQENFGTEKILSIYEDIILNT